VARTRCHPEDHRGKHGPRDQAEPQALEKAAAIFRALGDGQRLRLLELLVHGERCVSELVTALEEKFSTVSQRLRLLRSEGLIKRRRDGQHIYYSLTDRHVADLIDNGLAHAAEFMGGAGKPQGE
jgi:ArsR family transcriptional regulator